MGCVGHWFLGTLFEKFVRFIITKDVGAGSNFLYGRLVRGLLDVEKNSGDKNLRSLSKRLC